MSAIPQGAFASRKVRQNNNRLALISKLENKEEGKNYSYPKSPQEGKKKYFYFYLQYKKGILFHYLLD